MDLRYLCFSFSFIPVWWDCNDYVDTAQSNPPTSVPPAPARVSTTSSALLAHVRVILFSISNSIRPFPVCFKFQPDLVSKSGNQTKYCFAPKKSKARLPKVAPWGLSPVHSNRRFFDSNQHLSRALTTNGLKLTYPWHAEPLFLMPNVSKRLCKFCGASTTYYFMN